MLQQQQSEAVQATAHEDGGATARSRSARGSAPGARPTSVAAPSDTGRHEGQQPGGAGGRPPSGARRRRHPPLARLLPAVPAPARPVVVTTAPHSLPGSSPGRLAGPARRAGAGRGGDHPQLAARWPGRPRAGGAGDGLAGALAGPAVGGRASRCASRAALLTPRAALDGPAEVVDGAADPPGARLLDVVAVMDRLRSPGGCPWDAEQTHASLRPYLLEEAYEAYAAIEDGDADGLREELGDVLLQVVFHARLAEEADPPWSVDDVAAGLVAKLVRRHPHVFARRPRAGRARGQLGRAQGGREGPHLGHRGRAARAAGARAGGQAPGRGAAGSARPCPAYDGLGRRAVGAGRAAAARRASTRRRRCAAVARRLPRRPRGGRAGARAEGMDPAELTPEDWAARWRTPAGRRG